MTLLETVGKSFHVIADFSYRLATMCACTLFLFCIGVEMVKYFKFDLFCQVTFAKNIFDASGLFSNFYVTLSVGEFEDAVFTGL